MAHGTDTGSRGPARRFDRRAGCALGAGCRPGQRAPLPGGGCGRRRQLFPRIRERRLRRPPLRPRRLLRPGQRPSRRQGIDRGDGRAESLQLQPRPPWARGSQCQAGRKARVMEPHWPGTHRDAEPSPEKAGQLRRSCPLWRRTGRASGSVHPRSDRLHDHLRRRKRRRAARGGGDLVPRQRPSHRQGLLLLRGHRPGRLRGGSQRQAPRPRSAPRWPDRLAVGGAGADGLLSGDDRHRTMGRASLAYRRRGAGL